MHPTFVLKRSICVKWLQSLRGLVWIAGLTVVASGAVAAGAPAAKIILLPSGGSSREDSEISRWQDKIRSETPVTHDFERLGWAFVAKARRTQDVGYYKLAESVAVTMDERFGLTSESRLLRGHALHNLHRFTEAESVARALVADRGLAWDHSLLSDILMEQGRLDEAVEACQRAMNLRPGPETFARAAHLRWLKGDLPGATAAMTEAVIAIPPRETETRAWLLIRLSGYRLQASDLPGANRLAEQALSAVDDYAPALLAAGRVKLAQGEVRAALPLLRRAATLNPLPEYQWWLADALEVAGESEAALAVEAELVLHGEASDPRTLSLFLATRGLDPERAVVLARKERVERADVFTEDALAWALLAKGDVAAAEQSIVRALAEQTRDARLFYHAGVIMEARGRRDDAREYFKKSLEMAGTLTPSERGALNARIAVSQAEQTSTALLSLFPTGNSKTSL